MIVREIKNRKLRARIKELSKEKYGNGYKYLDKPLRTCFIFNQTSEGHDFWWGVSIGLITTLKQTR